MQCYELFTVLAYRSFLISLCSNIIENVCYEIMIIFCKNFLLTKLFSFFFLVPAVGYLPSFLSSSRSNDGATRLSPVQSPDEAIGANFGISTQIDQTNCDFQIPGTKIDDFYSHVNVFCAANTNTSPNIIPSDELVSLCLSQYTTALSDEAGTCSQSTSQDWSTVDATHRKVLESSAVFSANSCLTKNDAESRTTTINSSSPVNQMADTSFHEYTSDNSQQQSKSHSHTAISESYCNLEPSYVQNITNKVNKVSSVLQASPDGLWSNHGNSIVTSLHASSEQPSFHSTNNTGTVSDVNYLSNYTRVSTSLTSNHKSLSIYRDLSKSDTSITRAAAANMHTDASRTLDLF